MDESAGSSINVTDNSDGGYDNERPINHYGSPIAHGLEDSDRNAEQPGSSGLPSRVVSFVRFNYSNTRE